MKRLITLGIIAVIISWPWAIEKQADITFDADADTSLRADTDDRIDEPAEHVIFVFTKSNSPESIK